MSGDALDIGPWLQRVLPRWRRYAVQMLVAGALMVGATYLMPKWYRASAVLLPPEESDDVSMGMPIARLLARVPSFTGVTRYYTPSDIFKAILLSRTVQDSVIQQYDLRTVYKTKTEELTRKSFRKHVRVSLAPDGTIALQVEDRSAQRAADMANALVAELDTFNMKRRTAQAHRSRQFLERQLVSADTMVKRSSAALRDYEQTHHIVAPMEMESGSVSAASDILARKMALEVRLQVLESYLSKNNEEVVQVRTELETIKRQIGGLPRLGSDLAILMRDVKVYQQVYLLLSAQLEESRFREAMDTPTLVVMDPAIPPERKVRPVRWLWGLGAAVLTGLASLLWDDRRAGPAVRRANAPAEPADRA